LWVVAADKDRYLILATLLSLAVLALVAHWMGAF
jgi:hypothetical protein